MKNKVYVEKQVGKFPEKALAADLSSIVAGEIYIMPLRDFVLYHSMDLAGDMGLHLVAIKSSYTKYAYPVNIRYYSDEMRGWLGIVKLDKDGKMQSMENAEVILAKNFFETYGVHK